MATFEEANKKVHKVEDQWHYEMMTKCGFVPQDLEGIGFVRSYTYKHPNGDQITCTTGVNADHWSGPNGAFGYWKDLELFLMAKYLLIKS